MKVSDRAKGPFTLLTLLGLISFVTAGPYEFSNCYGGEGDFFQFGTGNLNGELIDFNQFKGKYGVPKGQQPDPNKCYLEVIGFPCNQFGYQEPSENFELMNTLKYVRPGYGFEPDFPITGKLSVNGQNESPIFTFLKARCSSPFGLIANITDITWTPIRNNDISWNFSKWTIDHTGQPFRRYTPRTDPKEMVEDIKELLAACEKDKSGPQQGEKASDNSSSTDNSNVNGPVKKKAKRTLIWS
eukprot:gene16926-18633_t